MNIGLQEKNNAYTAQGRIQSLERGGHLAEKELKTKKKKKKKKVTTIIASYPLPNISRLLCPIYSFIGKLHCLVNIVTALLE